MTKPFYYQTMITQHSWIFLSVYEGLRRKLFNLDLINMAHLGTRAFEEIGGEVVQTTTFVIRNYRTSQYKATYCRLVDYLSEDAKRVAYLEGSNQYHITQELIQRIPGNPIAYWVSEQFVSIFSAPAFTEYSISDGQNKTGNNAKYLREFWEVSNLDVGIGKRSKYILLKDTRKLTMDDRIQLDNILRISEPLRKAYELKQEFELVKASRDREEASRRLSRWIMRAQKSGLPEFIKVSFTYQNWSREILNSFEYPYTNGYIEGCNNRIKVLKRVSFGMPRFARFRRRIMHIMLN